jgi:uncharacterized SAM-binding protein YcdF (DUF218 family)
VSGLDDAPEIIVVLGGGLLPDGSPDAATVRRSEAAATLALERPQAAVIASGGGPLPSEPQHAAASARPLGPEARHIARILVERGVAPARIHVEDESMDTVGNAVFTAARYLKDLTPRPLALVTSPFHLDRARWIFARALPGWQITGHPAADGPEDAQRSEDEPTFRTHNEAMLAGVADGDLASMFGRLVARWSEYERYASRVR